MPTVLSFNSNEMRVKIRADLDSLDIHILLQTVHFVFDSSVSRLDLFRRTFEKDNTIFLVKLNLNLVSVGDEPLKEEKLKRTF